MRKKWFPSNRVAEKTFPILICLQVHSASPKLIEPILLVFMTDYEFRYAAHYDWSGPGVLKILNACNLMGALTTTFGRFGRCWSVYRRYFNFSWIQLNIGSRWCFLLTCERHYWLPNVLARDNLSLLLNRQYLVTDILLLFIFS